MLGRVILTVIVITGTFLTMQFVNQGVGPAIQNDLAIQQVTDPGASRLLRTTQDTQNWAGLVVFFISFILYVAIWKNTFIRIYKEANCSSSCSCSTKPDNTESVKKNS